MLSVFASKYNYERTLALMNCNKLYLRVWITDEHLAGICATSTFITNIAKPGHTITCHIILVSTVYVLYHIELPILVDFRKFLKILIFTLAYDLLVLQNMKPLIKLFKNEVYSHLLYSVSHAVDKVTVLSGG